MHRSWLVAQYEYKRLASQKSFILVLLSVPLLISLIIGLGVVMERLENNDAPVGYVDKAGLLADPIAAPQRASAPDSPGVPGLVTLLPFQTEEEARQALESRRIQAYYVVAEDYLKTNRVDLVYIEPPGENVNRQFWDFMQINRLSELPPEIARRAVAGSNLTVRWPEDMPGGGREFSQRTFINNFLPMIAGLALIILLFISSGYLMQVVVEEKENRTIEILVTSVTPNQLIGGKVLGIIGVALTQVVAWIVFLALVVFIGGDYLGVGFLRNLWVDPRTLLTLVAFALPSYVMIAALMASVGALVSEAQEAQQTTGLFALPIWAPYWLLALIIEYPDSPVSIGLTLFPLTALSTLSFRLAMAPVPTWQIALSLTLLILCAVGAVWLAGRAFRFGMVRYGQGLRWRDLVALGTGQLARPLPGGQHG
ncbi:MAG: ABC transporter permease [Anaerolineae bacterium]|nr:ABC transporter permease [Anaerolineae bacterium]